MISNSFSNDIIRSFLSLIVLFDFFNNDDNSLHLLFRVLACIDILILSEYFVNCNSNNNDDNNGNDYNSNNDHT